MRSILHKILLHLNDYIKVPIESTSNLLHHHRMIQNYLFETKVIQMDSRLLLHNIINKVINLIIF